MPRKPKKSKPVVSVSYASCRIVTNMFTRCFLCGAELKPMVLHECSRKETK